LETTLEKYREYARQIKNKVDKKKEILKRSKKVIYEEIPTPPEDELAPPELDIPPSLE